MHKTLPTISTFGEELFISVSLLGYHRHEVRCQNTAVKFPPNQLGWLRHLIMRLLFYSISRVFVHENLAQFYCAMLNDFWNVIGRLLQRFTMYIYYVIYYIFIMYLLYFIMYLLYFYYVFTVNLLYIYYVFTAICYIFIIYLLWIYYILIMYLLHIYCKVNTNFL